jgi:capsular polysaccharide export protein
MAKYISYLRKYLLENNIELVTMHNDLRWQHSLSIEICKELGVKYLITERGIFRPDTTTIDFQGVNAYSSLSKDKEFYKNYSVNEKTLRSYNVSKITNLKVNLKFILFIILNKIGAVLNLNTQVKNRGYSLIKYAKLFLKQKLSKKSSVDVSLPKKYLFVPLQVNTDTQLLIHSDFQDMQEFISKTEKEFYSLDTDVGLVFKIHPMEKGMVDYKFDTRSIAANSDTNELVQNSECVVTINSTVGFEAIQEHKKVIVLGEAFFKIDGIAVCSSKDSFKNDMKNILNGNIELDNETIEAFVKYLKYEYQVNGSLFNWDDETFEDIKIKIGLVK